MPFALVQSQLEPPSLDQVRAAFAETARAGLNVTAADAGAIRRDSFGILLERLTHEQAQVAQAALAGVGYATDIVDQRDLLDLPQARARIIVDPQPDVLHVHDALGRIESLPYDQVVLIAAGMVGDLKFSRELTQAADTQSRHRGMIFDIKVTESIEFSPRLEILFADEPWRIRAEGRRMTYRCLGDQMTRRAEVNFMLLVRKLASHVHPSILTRAAAAVASLDDTVAVFPNDKAFDEELVWHAWQAMRE